MSSNRKIMYLASAGPEIQAMLRRYLPANFDLLMVEGNNESQRLELLEETEALISGGMDLTRAHLEAAKKLKVVQHQGVGYQDRVPGAILKELGIKLAICSAGTAESVAEHALLLMLSSLRHLPYADSELRQGRFHNMALRPISRILTRKCVGLVGFGRVGRHLATVLKPFAVRGLVYDPMVTLSEGDEAELGFHSVDLDTVFAESDIISLHVPATPETEKLLCKENFAKMKDGVFIVNTCRGVVVNEVDLAEALASGKVGGAGLDVYDPEPPLPGNPLFGLKNITMTPHVASGPADTMELKFAACMQNIDRFFKEGTLKDEIIL